MISKEREIQRPTRVSGWVVPLCGALVALGCAAPAKGAKVIPSTLTGEPELHLDKELPLLGVEICFNAWDDNQNSLIDEGCDLHQGPLQVMIAWSEESADVDLFVRDPKGEIAYSGVGTNSGLTHSSDCPSEKNACSGQNYENVFVEQSELLGGAYQIRVRLEKMPEDKMSLAVALGIRVHQRSFAHEIVFFKEGQEVLLDLEVEGTLMEEKSKDKEDLPRIKGKE